MNNYRKRIFFYLISGIISGYILLTIIVLQFPFSIADREFSEEVQEHQFVFLDYLMKFISIFGTVPYSIIMVLATSLTFYLFNLKKESLFITLTLLSGLVTFAMKSWINRPRPSADMVRLIEIAKRPSFPSGHVFFYVVFFGFLALLMYQLSVIPTVLRVLTSSICFLLIFTIPISRVYLGAHWLTDVLGGFILGVGYLLTLSYLYLEIPDNS